jgi:hypothetical protein
MFNLRFSKGLFETIASTFPKSQMNDEETQPLIEPRQKVVSPNSILPPAAILLLIIGIFVGLKPQWMILHICRTKHLDSLADPNWERCSKNESVQAESMKWLVYNTISLILPSLILSPFYGGISDKWGRKPIIIKSIFHILFPILAFIMVDLINASLWMITFSYFLSGLIGGYVIFTTTVMSYFANTILVLTDVLHLFSVMPLWFYGAIHWRSNCSKSGKWSFQSIFNAVSIDIIYNGNDNCRRGP